MKSVFITAIVAAIANAKRHWNELHNYNFDHFIKEYNLPIHHGTEEYSMRHQIFNQELERVIQHNNSGASWKETINHMSHLTKTEKKAFLGRTKPKHEKLSSKMASNLEVEPLSALPTNVDWRTSGVVSAVKD